MAFSHKDSSSSGDNLAVRLISIEEVPAAGVSDIMGGATTVYTLDLENGVSGAPTWFRIYDNTSPTFGTTQPDILIRVHNGAHSIWTIAQGLTLSSALTINATDADGKDGSDAASAYFDVNIIAV
jgi:hypothetical protein